MGLYKLINGVRVPVEGGVIDAADVWGGRLSERPLMPATRAALIGSLREVGVSAQKSWKDATLRKYALERLNITVGHISSEG